MSQLKMLLASATAALALAVLGPLFFGTAPASADGPHMAPSMRTTTMVNTGTVRGNGIIQQANVNVQGRNNVVNVVQQAVNINEVNRNLVVNQNFVRPFRVIRPVVEVVQPVIEVVRPVFVEEVRPVSTPVFVPTFSIQSFSWMSFGPNWDAGWTLAQIQQLCQQYNQTVVVNPGAFNPNVQAVCDGSAVGSPY